LQLGSSVEKMSVIDAANGYRTTAGGYLQPHQAPPPTQYPGAFPAPAPALPLQPGYGAPQQPAGKQLAGMYEQQSSLLRSNSAMP
jgi:hypothetical protein